MFGGKSVILVGDFHQLPPVGGAPLLESLLQYYNIGGSKIININNNIENYGIIGLPSQHGAHIIENFIFWELTEQVRASNDPKQEQLASELRNSFDSNLPGALNKDFLKELIVRNTLSRIDYDDIEHGVGWSNAPLVVTSNIERYNLQIEFAKEFGRKNNKPVIVWYLPVSTHDHDQGSLVGQILKIPAAALKLYSLTSGRCGIFVESGPAFINENVNATNGLANGTPCTMHSLTLPLELNESHRKNIVDKIQRANPGEIVHLFEIVPEFINVQLSGDINWIGETLVEGKYVVPMGLRTKTTLFKNITPSGGSLKFYRHRIDPGFVITVHKIQGKTLDKIIIDLNERKGRLLKKITYAGLLVALTRTKTRNGIRILPLKKGTNLNYLMDLRPSPAIQIFMSGINKITGKWNPKDSQNCFNTLNQKEKKGRKRKLTTQSNKLPLLLTCQSKSKNNNVSTIKPQQKIMKGAKSTAILFPNYRRLCNQNMNLKPWYLDELTALSMNNTLNNLNTTEGRAQIAQLNEGIYIVDIIDVKSLKNRQWLTGSIISAYIYSLYRKQINQNDAALLTSVFDTNFYLSVEGAVKLYGKEKNNAETTLEEELRFEESQIFTVGKNNRYVLGDIFIPIHRPGHWICCILSPRLKTIYLIDSMRGEHLEVIEFCKEWYKEEYKLRQNGNISDVENWTVITGAIALNNENCPLQTDGTSCGVFVAMTALFWIRERRLITLNDFQQEDNMMCRLHMLYSIIQLHNNLSGIVGAVEVHIDNNIVGDEEHFNMYRERQNLRRSRYAKETRQRTDQSNLQYQLDMEEAIKISLRDFEEKENEITKKLKNKNYAI
jgi:hypothetical protein